MVNDSKLYDSYSMSHTSTAHTLVMIHSVKLTMLVMQKRVLIIPIVINVIVRVSSTLRGILKFKLQLDTLIKVLSNTT